MRRLLIVDDDSDFREFVEVVALELGFEVLGVGDGEQAEAAQKSFSPDLILIDMVMPGLDGIEVVRKMAENAVNARIVLVSGYSPAYMNAARAIATASGIGSVQTASKPFALDELRTILSQP